MAIIKKKKSQDHAKPGKSLSRRELVAKATQGAVLLGVLRSGIPVFAQGQLTGVELEYHRRVNKELLYRALVDPAFRTQLEANPAAALKRQPQEITPKRRQEISQILNVVRQIEDQLARIADELLCANGGPCGIARQIR
jgi:hypothetical protein